MDDRGARGWIWASLTLQLIGYVFDALWHGLVHPGVEPATVRDMALHLATVHLPLYVGAASALASTATAVLRRRRRSSNGRASTIAVLGAVVSAGAEGWHAASHLRLDTHSAPIAGTLSFVGFLVVVVAMSRSRRGRRSRAAEATTERDAA